MEPDTTKKMILLVDDEEDIRDVLTISLEDMGYDVSTAENGEQALEKFITFNPPIVITDIKMPGMDGIELLTKIKRINSDTEIVMITGHGDMSLAIKSFKNEAVEFITKPIDIDDLEKALKSVEQKIRSREHQRRYTESLEAMLHEKSMLLKKVERIAGFLNDNGETKKKDDEKFQKIFNELPCYINIIDRDYKFSTVNDKFSHDFGDVTGKICYEVCKKTNSPCEECPVEKTFKDGKSHQQEMTYITPENNTQNVFIWTSPLRTDAGQISAVMVMATNISQMLKMQDHLSSLGLMIGSISHSIKGLLTGLDGGIYILDSGISNQKQAQTDEGLQIVKDMVERIRKMILNILFYAKDRKPHIESIDAIKLAEDAAVVVQLKMKNKGIKFNCNFDHTGPVIDGDNEALHSCLVNILENAMDACVEGNSKGDHEIDFDLKGQNNRVEFHVKDDGIGMDEETNKNIFNLFYSSKGKKGTGLGLFITKKIVEQHGGNIRVVKTSKGAGTHFLLWLPKHLN